MKLNKKKVFVISLAVCLVAILSMGSLAWFSAEDSVTNNFNFADSDDNGTPDFGVDVVESNDTEDDGNTYDNILPGDVLVKDPTIINTSTTAISAAGTNYTQWIRATITLSDSYGGWRAAETAGRVLLGDLKDMFQTVDTNVWTLDSAQYNEDDLNYTFVYYLNAPLAPGATANLFTTVKIPTALTVGDAAALGNTFDVTIKAEAVQYYNLEATSAKDAFAKVGK